MAPWRFPCSQAFSIHFGFEADDLQPFRIGPRYRNILGSNTSAEANQSQAIDSDRATHSRARFLAAVVSLTVSAIDEVPQMNLKESSEAMAQDRTEGRRLAQKPEADAEAKEMIRLSLESM